MADDTMRLVVFPAAQQAELQEAPVDASDLGADEITGPTLVSLISPGTELGGQYVEGNYPAQPGYAGVFRAEAVGANVTDIAPGDTVFCTGPHGYGGHRSVQRVPRIAAIKVPEGLDPAVAAHARLMGVTMSTLTTTAARPGEKVLVTGLGTVGHLGAQLFAACGYDVIAVEPDEERRSLAASKGIDAYPAVPLDDKAAIDNIALVLECSGHEQAVLDGLSAVRKGGEVVLVGVPRQRKTDIYAFDVLQKVFRGYVRLRSGWEWEVPRHGADFLPGSVFGSLRAAIKWLADGRVDVGGLYQTTEPADCQVIYQGLLNHTTAKPSVVFDWR